MTKRKSPGDDASFAEAVAHLKDLAPINRDQIAKHAPPTARQRAARVATADSEKPSKPSPAPQPQRVVASRAELKLLRAGKIRPQRIIDLHGFTRAHAYRRLCNEVARSTTAGIRCVLVIHGKGQRSSTGSTTIKESLAEWLGQPPLAHQVSGCTLAQARDGGSGASYLLLR